MRFSGDHGLHGDLRYWPVPELVALDLPGGTGFVDALQAVWDTGDAATPLDPRLPAAARQAMLEALRPTRIVGSDGEQHALHDGVPVAEGDALVLATSGTSGGAKGVVLTHDAVAASALATSARLGVDRTRHTWLACLPLAHIGGLSVVTRAIITGTPLLVMPSFAAEAVEAAGRSGGVTHVSLVATALHRLDSSVFTCVLLGGSRPPDALSPNVVTTYGMTETGSGVVYDGTPLNAVELALRPLGDETTTVTDAPTGPVAAAAVGRSRAHLSGGRAEGEILIRAPMLFRCYRDGTDGRVQGPDGRTDWFATGDAGRLDSEGRLTVSGRIAEVIVTGAEMVWPEIVERVLVAHPLVAEVAVWRRADPEWGERVVAWIVPAGSPPPLAELRDMVTESVAPWAAPRELVVVAELPRTSGGKLLRRGLEALGS